ncbi:hypothetical protein POM88_051396 [Heracleum sosnowskyi]|uniref:Transmembrane protein n=1 Tax=Heracleum sosnowskyi TaxID=360622 RepID=A0AAD8M184_9APIA|nr:hypothetical protein POM88_051396 [Heracleum sosnowskyi]
MKIKMIRCLSIILLCVQLLIVTSFAVENKLSTSVKKNLDNHAVTTVVAIHPTEEHGSKSRVEVKDMVVVSKKSSGKKGSGGGNNVVRDPAGKKKNDAVSKLPQTMSFYISVCLFLALSL